MGPSWGALGRFWALLGGFWGALGRSGAGPGPLLGRSWAHLGAPGRSLGALGALLGPPGALLGSLGALRGGSWAFLGHFWIAFLVVDLLGDLLENLVGDVQAPLLPLICLRSFPLCAAAVRSTLNPPRTRANGVLDPHAFVLAFILNEVLAGLLEERGTLSL